MSKASAVALIVLAALAIAGALAGLIRLPYVQPPERFTLVVAGTLILCGLAAFWLLSGIRLLKAPGHRVGPFLRACAWLVLVVGCILWLGERVEPFEQLTSPVLSLTCVLSAVGVLAHGRRDAGA